MTEPKYNPDVLVVGGGPAGMSAAGWCAELGLDVLLLEKAAELGGQLLRIHNPILNYLGREAKNGRELLSYFASSRSLAKAVNRFGTAVTKIDPASMTVYTDEGDIRTRAIVLATGVRRRKLEIPGELEFAGAGILESGVRDRELVKGKRVLIVGGGDAAFENAMILADYAHSVKIAFRKPEPTAREDFQHTVRGLSNIELLSGTRVTQVNGDGAVASVDLAMVDGSHNWNEPIDFLLIRIGVEPNSELLRGIADLDEKGYIKIDSTGRTSVSSVYAAGDVAHPLAPTISTAAGTGAAAAKAIYSFMREGKRL